MGLESERLDLERERMLVLASEDECKRGWVSPEMVVRRARIYLAFLREPHVARSIGVAPKKAKAAAGNGGPN